MTWLKMIYAYERSWKGTQCDDGRSLNCQFNATSLGNLGSATGIMRFKFRDRLYEEYYTVSTG